MVDQDLQDADDSKAGGAQMTSGALPGDPVTGGYDEDGNGDGYGEVPPRPRTKLLSPVTAALMALILGGVGFYVGIRVEKSSGGGGSTPAASALTALRGTGRSGGAGGSGSRTAAFGRGGFFGAGGGASGATIGSVTSIDGNTLYVKETSGNTVKVKLGAGTTVSKTQSVSKKKIYPGDQVVIAGAKGSGGAIAATSVTDSGASSSAGGGSSATSSSSATGAAAVKSLFGGS